MFNFKKKEKNPIISFVAMMEGMTDVEEVLPKRSSFYLPSWWRSIPRFEEGSSKEMTVKSCPSFTDYFSQGFVLPAWADMELYYKKETKSWSGNIAHSTEHNNEYYLDNHPNSQFLDYVDASYMGKEAGVVLKAVSPWKVITRPGWSIMQLPMFYHFDQEFVAMPGIIDTDIEHAINLQMMLLNPEEDTTIYIKRGEPLALFIPFERSNSATKDDLEVRQATEADLKKVKASSYWATSKFAQKGAYRKAQIERDRNK